PGVPVAVVEHHALAPAELEDRLAYPGGGHPGPELDVEGAGQLGVPHRRRGAAERELEPHLEDDVAPGGAPRPAPAGLRVAERALEHARAVAEPELADDELAGALGEAVVDPDGLEGLGDLLTVGADVLHRGGAGGAGDAGQGLDPPPALLDGGGDDLVPRLARRDGDERPGAGVARAALDPASQVPDHDTGEAVVGGEQVGPA